MWTEFDSDVCLYVCMSPCMYVNGLMDTKILLAALASHLYACSVPICNVCLTWSVLISDN